VLKEKRSFSIIATNKTPTNPQPRSGWIFSYFIFFPTQADTKTQCRGVEENQNNSVTDKLISL
jgi:hypothetical protein